ncbi:MAG: hypothetical protein JW806_08310 [Sedimentisphaerales bacterium]|nr:hypothetical protein [Sedimentisphaerales bacterium]
MKRFSITGLIIIATFCLTSNVFARGGWADMNGGTTGGAGGAVVDVNNYTDLETYAESSSTYIIRISGTIDIGSDGFDIAKNKTLIGVGTDATLSGNVGFKNRDGNIILENLHIHNPYTSDEGDGLSITQDIYNVLVTKCSVYDCEDGGLDVSNRSDFVTVSWCKFYYTPATPDPTHCFSTLVGARDSLPEDANYLRVTYHHNWWTTGVKERMPRVRYGQVHVYNNYYSDLVYGGYCIGVGCGARIRVENNYFNAVYTPWKDYYSDAPEWPVGHIGWNTGNIYYNCTQPTWATNEYATIFVPPYEYDLDDAADIPTLVQAYAGAGTPYPPHWYSGAYGDFDLSGTVDRIDLATFVDYWLETTGIEDADYYPDGIVNFRELAKLAESWLLD